MWRGHQLDISIHYNQETVEWDGCEPLGEDDKLYDLYVQASLAAEEDYATALGRASLGMVGVSDDQGGKDFLEECVQTMIEYAIDDLEKNFSPVQHASWCDHPECVVAGIMAA
jgi:hypothetical protein